MEIAIVVEPNDDDDIDKLNTLFQMGWKTASETAFPGYGDECRILFRLVLCGCAMCREARGELDDDTDFDDPDYEDDWDDDECDGGWGDKPSDN